MRTVRLDRLTINIVHPSPRFTVYEMARDIAAISVFEKPFT